MFSNDDRIWQAWQRTQLLYAQPAVREAMPAIEKIFRTTAKSEEPGGKADVSGARFLSEVRNRDPLVGESLEHNLSIIGELAGRVCTIAVLGKMDGHTLHYRSIEEVSVIASGLVSCEAIRVSFGYNHLPMLTVEAEHPQKAPAGFRFFEPPNRVSFFWNVVRGVHLHD